jgi:chitinase
VSVMITCQVLIIGLMLSQLAVYAFIASANTKIKANLWNSYWGQDSAGHQQRLSFYCQDDTIDIIPMAFLYVFRGKGGLPVIDFSNVRGLFLHLALDAMD